MADGFELLTAAHAYLLAAVRGVPADGWGSASPCSDWTVAQVLNHARLDQQALTMKIGGTPPAGDPFAPGTEPGADPVAELEAVLKDSAAAWESVRGAETVETPVGTMPPAQGAAVAALDAAVHAWDIARGTGQDLPLDDDLAAGLHASTEGFVSFVRDSYGLFAPGVALAEGASPAAVFLAHTGRDAGWQRPSA